MRTCVRDKSRIGVRALSSGSLTQNLTIIDAAARELPSISLADALTIVTLLAQKHDPRYGRAAARWVARVVLEQRLELGGARAIDPVGQAHVPSADVGTLRVRSACETGPARRGRARNLRSGETDMVHIPVPRRAPAR
jgi:hypothetical protein